MIYQYYICNDQCIEIDGIASANDVPDLVALLENKTYPNLRKGAYEVLVSEVRVPERGIAEIGEPESYHMFYIPGV